MDKHSSNTDELIKHALYELELEGLKITPEDEKDIRDVLNGTITREELIRKLKTNP